MVVYILSMAAFLLLRQSGEVASETYGPQSLKRILFNFYLRAAPAAYGSSQSS